MPDPGFKKDNKGRRQKKRLKGDMDASQPRYTADYSYGDFDADKSQNRCSKCHAFIKNCKCRPKTKNKTRTMEVTEIYLFVVCVLNWCSCLKYLIYFVTSLCWI